MKLMIRIITVITVVFSVVVISGCDNQQPTLSQQQQNTMSQLKADFLKLEERVKMLENQNKALNDEIYQLNKRTEALEEVYDYVARDSEMPSTGEEPPAD